MGVSAVGYLHSVHHLYQWVFKLFIQRAPFCAPWIWSGSCHGHAVTSFTRPVTPRSAPSTHSFKLLPGQGLALEGVAFEILDLNQVRFSCASGIFSCRYLHHHFMPSFSLTTIFTTCCQMQHWGNLVGIGMPSLCLGLYHTQHPRESE